MLKLGAYLTAILVCGSQIIRQSNAMPPDSIASFVSNKTTTAIPVHDGSKTVAVPRTPTMSTAIPVTPTTNGKYATKTTANAESSVPSAATKMASTTVPTVSFDRQAKSDISFITTTAVSLSAGSVASDRRFDSLSFVGGTLAAISVIAVGTLAWKMYKARIERSYWTL